MKILFLAITVLIGFSFSANTEKDEIWTEQCKIQKVIDYEKALSSKSEFLEMNVTLSRSIYPLSDQYKTAKPIIVKREQTGFLPLYAEYFYSESDSILRFISYDWERDKYGNFFKKQEIWNEESKKLKKYNREYERIKSNLVTQFGKPTIEDKEPKKVKSTSDRGDYLTRNTNWETESYHAELSLIFESMTYRIRMNYYWKK